MRDVPANTPATGLVSGSPSRPEQQRYPATARIGRFNAWFFDTFDGLIDWSARRMKRRVFTDLPDTIVEIGPGVGANFRYYTSGSTVIAIEPNPAMHDRLVANAKAAGINLVLKPTLAESTGLPDQSADVVVSSLVLCTVVDPKAAVAEVNRILKPGGRLLMVEHVKGRGPMLRLLQGIVARPWKGLFEGCELSRNTIQVLSEGGFDTTKLVEKTVPTVFVPINSFLFGEATK